jgi:hypothetical protein
MIYALIGLAIAVYTIRIKALADAIRTKNNSLLKGEILFFVLITVLFALLTYYVWKM